MLSQFNINEVTGVLEKNNVPSEDHEFITRQIEYDMWDFKVKESNAKQRDQIKFIQKSATSLLKNLRCLSWELSTELHDELENKFSPKLTLDEEDEGNFDNDEFENIDFKFRKALENNTDNLTLQLIYDEGVEDAFSNVPICGAANAIDYASKLASACQALIDKKTVSKDKELYPALQFRWDMIGEKYDIEVSKTNSIEFISACTSKDLESAKKQYQRLGIQPHKIVVEGATEVLNLERHICERYIDDWHRLFSMPSFVESECSTVIHWILVDSFQSRQGEYSNFKAYLQDVSENGIGDIIEKYE